MISSNAARLLMSVMLLGLGTGCSIHMQAPIKEVAYDFSDRDFYDRAYAPSPTYFDKGQTAQATPQGPTTNAPSDVTEITTGGSSSVVVVVVH